MLNGFVLGTLGNVTLDTDDPHLSYNNVRMAHGSSQIGRSMIGMKSELAIRAHGRLDTI